MSLEQFQLVWEAIQEIRNSTGIMNNELGDLVERVAVVETQISILMKMFWIVMTTTGGLLIAAVWRVIIHYKKNNRE